MRGSALAKIKALVTGSAGFIGFFLAKHLAEQGQEVTLCDNHARGKRDEEFNAFVTTANVRFIHADLTKKEDVEKLGNDYDYVYHLAAMNGTKYFYEIPHEVLRVNVQSTINILEWFIKSKCKKIIFASSSETYAGLGTVTKIPYPTPETVPLIVSDVFNPRWSYGGSKILGELFFINYARQYKRRVSIIRYANIYGPRMGYEHIVPEFLVRIINKENPFKIFGAEPTRTYCYVEDAVKATRLVMESEKTDNEVINIGTDREEITGLDLAKKMFTLFGASPELEIHPAPKGCVMRRCPDVSKLKRLTGFESATTLNEGLKKTYEWYKNHSQ
jgi:nucleoside-diphosphate-sugar epimerase